MQKISGKICSETKYVLNKANNRIKAVIKIIENISFILGVKIA